MSTRKTNAKVSPAKVAKVATREKKERKAPGNATAVRAKANDNLKAQRERREHPDRIATVKLSNDQHYVVVVSNGGEMFNRSTTGDSKAFREIAQVNSSFNAAQAWHEKNPAPKPQAKLARGIESRQAPHSAKAVRDQKAPAKAEAKGKAKSAPKAAKNKAPSRGAERNYKVNAKVENKARLDSWRYHMTVMIVSATDTAKAKANHAKSGKFSANKLDFNWAAKNGFITFTA